MAEPKNFQLLEIDFTVPQPYDEGYGRETGITAGEARALNQLFKENLANNFRAQVQAFKDGAEGAAGTEDELRERFAALAAEYKFTIANTGSAARKLDPVEREARNIARDLLKSALAADGLKYKEPPEGTSQEEWDNFIETKLDEIAALPEVVDTAKKTVKARQGASKITLAGLGIGGGGQQAEQAATE